MWSQRGSVRREDTCGEKGASGTVDGTRRSCSSRVLGQALQTILFGAYASATRRCGSSDVTVIVFPQEVFR